MPRKSNSEKDVVTAAAAQPRRAPTAPRAKHAAKPTGTPATPARDPESPARATAVAREPELSHDEIARLAYALWEARGGQGGNPEEDWRRAEEQLRQRVFSATA